ncbi:hypothetical protein JNW90_13770 [Micromonospora sp. STR1s_5]|nr:hypothetical protein [Micromonospora sp. STR1s_5]
MIGKAKDNPVNLDIVMKLTQPLVEVEPVAEEVEIEIDLVAEEKRLKAHAAKYLDQCIDGLWALANSPKVADTVRRGCYNDIIDRVLGRAAVNTVSKSTKVHGTPEDFQKARENHLQGLIALRQAGSIQDPDED